MVPNKGQGQIPSANINRPQAPSPNPKPKPQGQAPRPSPKVKTAQGQARTPRVNPKPRGSSPNPEGQARTPRVKPQARHCTCGLAPAPPEPRRGPRRALGPGVAGAEEPELVKGAKQPARGQPAPVQLVGLPVVVRRSGLGERATHTCTHTCTSTHAHTHMHTNTQGTQRKEGNVIRIETETSGTAQAIDYYYYFFKWRACTTDAGCDEC
jgi:hypothetical protein